MNNVKTNMQKEITRETLRQLLETILEQQEIILEQQGKIPAIELDILKDNVKKYYESLLILNELRNISSNAPAEKPAFREEQIMDAPVEKPIFTQEENMMNAPVASLNDPSEKSPSEPPLAAIAEEQLQPPATVQAEVHIQPENIIANVNPVVIKEDLQTPSASIAANRTKEFSRPSQKVKSLGSLFDESPTVAATYSGSPTVFDKYGVSKTDKSISESLQNNPVTDLRKSIGINEKFSFINELFDGDLSCYNEAIDKLNSCSNISQALEILQNELSQKYQWTGDGISYIQLKNLVDRRFSA